MNAITCPGCQKTIRVPDDVLGQRARCPFCKCHFWAPTKTENGLGEPLLIRRFPLANRRVLAGTLLLFVAGIGLISNSIQAVQAFADPESFEAKTREFFETASERSNNPELRDAIPTTVRWLPWVRVASGALSLIALLGAIAMLRAKRYGLALFGSVVGMFNIANCCCFGCIFIGGWCVSVLLNAKVKAEFR